MKNLKPIHFILLGVLILVVGVAIGANLNRTPASDTTQARKVCTGDCKGISAGGIEGYAAACCKSNLRTRNAALVSGERSKGCTCVGGTISNYGIGSNISCNQWGKYCEGNY